MLVVWGALSGWHGGQAGPPHARYMTVETISAVSDTFATSMPAWPAETAISPAEDHRSYTMPWDTIRQTDRNSLGDRPSSMADITLDDEQRRWVTAALRKVMPDAGADTAETLCRAVEASMAAWTRTSAPTPTFRQAHDQQRELWHLAREPDPKVGIIRQRFAALPSDVIARLEVRAGRLRQRSLGRPLPPGGLLAWLRQALPAELVRGVQLLIGEGGQPVQGRLRPSDRRSAWRLEPVIDGVVRGVTPDVKRTRAVGRPPEHAAYELVMMLAIDWALATGAPPPPGRSDATPFGDLVHHVFGWLNLDNAGPAMRRYWAAVGRGRARRHRSAEG